MFYDVILFPCFSTIRRRDIRFDVIYLYERGLNDLMEKVFAGVFNLQLRKNNL